MTDINQKQIDLELANRKEAQRLLEKSISKEIDRTYYSSTAAGRYEVHTRIKSFAERIEKEITSRIGTLIGKTNLRQMAQPMDNVVNLLGNSISKSDLKKLKELFGDEHTDAELCRQHGLYAVAMIGLKTILDHYCREKESKQSCAKIAMAIGNNLSNELEFLHTYYEGSEAVKKVGKKKAREAFSTPKNRRYAPVKKMKNKMRREGVEPTEYFMSNAVRAELGTYIIELAIAENLIDTKTVIKGKKQQKLIFHTELVEALKECEAKVRSKVMIDEPLLRIPEDWVSDEKPDRANRSGGYLTKFAKAKKPLCRSYYSDTKFGQYAIDTVNNLQRTAWAIDNAVYDVAKEIFYDEKFDYTIGSFQPVPPVVKELIPDETLNEDEKIKRILEKKDEHLRHLKLERQHVRTASIMGVAKHFEHKGEFYYPWSADWRGRLYPATTWLHIQGTDFERSLLRFREGCELTDKAKKWAARAVGAAKLGTSGSYQDREDWVKENEELIKVIANEPLSYINLWSDAKEPWSFLQLCIEWNKVVIEGTKALWHIPVGIDSTASGLQLLSAIRRDKKGMEYANLLPSNEQESPMDAYMHVLELARKNATANDEEYLTQFMTNRKCGKPALMLSVYGGSFPTIRERIEEVYKDTGEEVSRADVNKITKYILDASKEVFPAAYEALKWLKTLARKALTTTDRLEWTTPLEDRIDLTQNKLAIMTIHTEIMGKVNVCLGEESDAPDVNSMVDSFAPSYIHSLDACVVKAAFHNWDKPLALIHDCLRVQACDMTEAVEKIKSAFIRVCEDDPLSKLASDLGLPDDYPRLPQGDDSLLSKVHDSEYLFN